MIKYGVVNGRFQVLHLKHLEYILAAKMRCEKLYIGLSNPDGRHIKDVLQDINRSAPSANPLSYYERCEMIRGAMREFNVPEDQYEMVPYPINYPEYILQYLPKEAVHFLALYDSWDEEKYRILKEIGAHVEVLWKKTEEEKGVTASMIRNCMATGQEWQSYVPKSVYRYLTELDLDKRIARLENMRIDEKKILIHAEETLD